MASIKSALKAVRASQPFNVTATTFVKAACALAGTAPEVVVKHLHRVGNVRAKLPNGHYLRLWSLGDDWVSNRVYWRGWTGYDGECGPTFFRLAQRADVVLDVGAYVGFYTLLAGHANPEGRIHAFEPLPAIHERLTGNVALNKLSNVECHLAAVGETSGLADYFHGADLLPTSSSLSFDFMKTAADVQRSTVRVIRLDEFIESRQISRVDLMKVDTESTEPEVLRGMKTVLARDRPHIVCEVLPGRNTERAIEEVLQPLGYRYYLLTPEGPQPTDRIVGHPEWLNYLLTPMGAEELLGLVRS